MKRLSKILILALALSLLCGVVFAVASSAAQDPTTISIDGASRTHDDFTEAFYDRMKFLNSKQDTPAGGQIADLGTYPSSINATGILNKFGRVRAVSTASNTYMEFLLHQDYSTDTLNKNNADVNVTLNSLTKLNEYTYNVVEFDMATRTDYPGNLRILAESRFYLEKGTNGATSESEYTYGDKSHYRPRPIFGVYDASTGLWTFGSTSLLLEANEWVHVTIVYDVNSSERVTSVYTKTVDTTETDGDATVSVTTTTTTTVVVTDGVESSHTTTVSITRVSDNATPDDTSDDTTATESTTGESIASDSSLTPTVTTEKNYGSTVAKCYLNGELVNTVSPYNNVYINEAYTPRIHYLGIGFEYGKYHVGTEAGDSVAFDNLTETSFTNENENLATLFASEDPRTNIADLGEEIVFTSDYVFPSSDLGTATVTDADGNVTVHAEFADAMAYVKENALVGATIKLYSLEYDPATIDYPVTVDLNGHKFHNGYTLSDGLTKTDVTVDDTVTGFIVTGEIPEELKATFNIYTTEYSTSLGTPALTESLSLGASYTTVAVGSYLSGSTTVKVPTGEWVVYGADGTAVDFSTVTEEHLGNTYTVCPVFNNMTSSVANPAFYVTSGETVSYYASNNLSEAIGTTKSSFNNERSEEVSLTHTNIPDGATVTFLTDCTTSTTLGCLGTIYIDLNGHAYYGSVSMFYSMRGLTSFVYSSAEGAEISLTTALVNGEWKDRIPNRACYFGYENASTKSESRISIYVPYIVYQMKGTNCKLYFNNCDVYNTQEYSKGLLSFDWGRDGRTVTFDNCNVYTQSTVHSTYSGAVNSTVTFNNSNIYGTGDTRLGAVMYGSTSGTQTTVLNSTNVYGMTYGDYNANGGTHKVSVSGECNLSFYPVSESYSGKIQASVTEVTFEGVSMPANGDFTADRETAFAGTYTANYKMTSASKLFATYLFYQVPKELVTSDTTPATVYYLCADTFLGSDIYASQVLPTGDPDHFFVPTGEWAVYDEYGNRVSDVTKASSAAATYYAYLVCEEKETAFTVVDSYGQTTCYAENNITEAYASSIASGATVRLYKTCCASATLLGNNSYVDLNGQIFYPYVKNTLFCATADKALYVYSSREGAKIYAKPETLTSNDRSSATAYIASLTSNYKKAKIYIGYSDASTKSEYMIDIFCGAFSEIKQATNGEIHVAKANICATGGDNYGFFNVRFTTSGAVYTVEDCNIYKDNYIFTVRDGAADGSFTVKNTNIYGSAYLAHWMDCTTEAVTVNLEDTNLYGSRGLVPSSGGTVNLNLTGTCRLTQVDENTVTTEDGILIIPTSGSVTTEGMYGPTNAKYGDEEVANLAGTYTYSFITGTESDYRRTAYQNVSLDTNINVNTYLPVWSFISSVKLADSDTELLDAEKTLTIGDGEYYIITVGEAPKDAYDSASIVVTFANGDTATFESAINYYAKSLLTYDASTSEYLADSQEMIKYVMNYIKEVSLVFGDATEEDFADFTGALDITVDTDVEFTEPTDCTTSTVNAYIEGAALELANYTGMVFKVKAGFVGTIKAELGSVAVVEETYTEDSPAIEGDYVILSNIPAHTFRTMITITVTPADGEQVSAEFNLATYVAAINQSYATAVYAYSVKASEYIAKYPTVGELD